LATVAGISFLSFIFLFVKCCSRGAQRVFKSLMVVVLLASIVANSVAISAILFVPQAEKNDLGLQTTAQIQLDPGWGFAMGGLGGQLLLLILVIINLRATLSDADSYSYLY
jgi:hypothetical protein